VDEHLKARQIRNVFAVEVAQLDDCPLASPDILLQAGLMEALAEAC